MAGIFNSTCNFVLTSMLRDGMSYDDAIAEAKKLGYAEADPTLDVSGMDTAHKLTILASLAFGLNLDFNKVTTTASIAFSFPTCALPKRWLYGQAARRRPPRLRQR